MKLTHGSSPHIRTTQTAAHLMGPVLLALLPALAVGVWQLGFTALWVTLCCTAAAVAAQWLCSGGRSGADGSAAVTGLLLAMTLPPTLPLWLAAAGGAFAVVAGKQLWGGLGRNVFNPALTARAAMLLCFPRAMTDYHTADAVTSATPLHQMALHDLPHEGVLELFLGLCHGSVGEISTLALLLGGVYLVWRRVISWRIPVSYLATVAVLTLVLFRSDDPLRWMLSQLCSGGLVLGAVYMATDYTTSPVTPRGRLLYGVGCGALTVLFRYTGIFPEGVTYAILLMNGLTWAIDRATPPRRFGVKKGASG
ncbi:MAG: RnfABCDGE type electron transport complex subunit D [Oscillospiraceae bacterium]|nr:RnfABCDGE type electron transport complex subunit D [Oscillospiraceae bacterium]